MTNILSLAALQLADEYGMRLWIEALLDPAPIEKGTKDRHNNHIQTPPLFDISTATPPVLLPPTSSLRPTRARSTRSASPSKAATPARKMASPRKSRTTRSAVKPDAEEVVETAATSLFQNTLENGAATSESVASESINGEVKEPDTVRIEVQETVEKDGDVETTTTNVKIDVPADHPALPTPEDPTELIESAKRMVEEAQKLEGGIVQPSKSSKRKVDEVSRDENEGKVELVERPAKQAKTTTYTTEQKLKKEQVTRRALVGLGVMAAIGYVATTLSYQNLNN